MASWTLGRVFSVDEEKEATQDPSVSDGESSDDEDAQDREAAFNRNKQKNNNGAAPAAGSNRSIRRYDEFGDFLTRSERAHNEMSKAESSPSSKRMERQGSGPKGKVSFRDADSLEEVHEIPKITREEKNILFMGTDNWVSIDTDIEITTKRWNNHVEGTIPFDEDNNSVRGIEDMIFRIDKNKPIAKHRKIVLEEVVRQKTANEFPNWEKLSIISESSSASHRERAATLGKEDEKERNRIWEPKKPEPAKKAASKVTSNKNNKKSKRKSSFFGLFKKK